MKVAIVEQLAVHEEVIPSMIRYLNMFDVVPDVYYNPKSFDRKGNIFSLFGELKFNLVSSLRAVRFLGAISDLKYDWTIINTYAEPLFDRVVRLPGKKICIVHNVRRVNCNQDIARREDFFFLTLGHPSRKALELEFDLCGVKVPVGVFHAS